MLNGSVLSKHFWTEAVRISCYTQNRSIIFKGNNKTPYEIFRERIPNISPLDLINTKGTQEQEVLNELINIQPTEESLGNNTKISVPITRSSILEVTQSQIIHHASTSSHPVSQDRWSRDQHIKLVNIIDKLTKCMLTRSIATKLTVASTSECLFVEFLSKIEPKKVYEALKHLGWVDVVGFIQDKWLKDQHIELVNIIGDPGEGMLTRSMAAKLIAASASKCLFVDFLSEIEPKKVFEALKHPGWAGCLRLYSWEEGIDYDETFAPVARMEAIRIFLAFATYMNFIVFQMNIKSAFLNGKPKEEVYVRQPPGFESSEFPDYVWKLDKALYGLKQAPTAWYETLSTFLIQNKFLMGRIDNTLFIYKSKGDVLLVQVMMGEVTYFLGLQIKHDDKGMSICKEKYTRDLLKKYEISDSSSVKTPMVPLNNLGPDLAGKPVNETLYRGMIGSLMYLTASRPDIQFSTCLRVRYQSNPKESHLIAVKRILTYLKVPVKLPGGQNGLMSAKKQSSVAIPLLKAEYTNSSTRCAKRYNPNPPIDSFKAHPLKEFIIKFTVRNSQKPLNLDYKTFCESTGLDYNNDQHVDHPSTEVVKDELAKIATNKALVQKTSSPHRTKIDIGEIIFSDLVTMYMAKSKKKYISYHRFVSCSLEGLLGKRKGLPATHPDDGTSKTQPLPEGKNIDRKDSGRNTQLTDRGQPKALVTDQSGTSIEDQDPSKVTPIELTASLIEGINHESLVTPLPFSEKRGKKKS
ncbi:retrovirus-related pol polyprotein from transposon TNT 1-94 [Tanacetum coccineum]